MRYMPAIRDPRLLLLMLLALLHGLAYAWIVPLWQAPDEPMLFEYSALLALLGRVPTTEDADPALSRAIAASLLHNDFYRYRLGEIPDPPPQNLAELNRLIELPRQVGGDPPLYFALTALPLQLVSSWSIDAQMRLLRLLNVLLLPITVLATYLAATMLLSADRPSRFGSSQPPVSAGLIPLAAAGLVAFQPMLHFIGASVSNDGLANLFGALATVGLVWLLRRGLRVSDLLLLGALIGLGLLVKRSLLPFLLLWIALAGMLLLRLLVRRSWPVLLLCLAMLGLSGLWFVAQFDRQRSFGWLVAATETPAERVAGPDGYALPLRAGEEVVQSVPQVGTAMLRSNVLQFGAQLRSDAPAQGRLVVYSGDQRQEAPFELDGLGNPSIRVYIRSYAPDVRLGIVADSGSLYADSIWAHGLSIPGDLVLNGGADWPALQPDSWLHSANRYLRVGELAWALHSGHLSRGLPWEDLLRRLHGSFWGEFGWMELRLVQYRAWEPLLLLFGAVGISGALAALVRPPPGLARPPLAALLLVLLLMLLPVLLNAFVDPNQIQQGRYLLPMLPALALVLALGYAQLVPRRLHAPWLLIWIACWAGLALHGLLITWQKYAEW